MKTILVDAIHCFVIKGEGIYQPMYDLLETYPNSKIILTGANDEQIAQHGLDIVPYPVFTLKHNPEKTDPLYYTTMLDELGLITEDVIYFENALTAVESARSVGINTYHYDRDTKDLDALKVFLDTNL